MPKALVATANGLCERCGQPYLAGDQVTYSKVVPGSKFHFSPTCKEAAHRSSSPAVSAPEVISEMKATTPDQLASLREAIAAIHAANKVPVAAPSATPVAIVQPPVQVAAPVAPKPVVVAPLSREAAKLIKSVTSRSSWWETLEGLLAAGLWRIMLVGPPGTGKSTTANTCNLRVTCHEDMGPEALVGTFIQKDGNTIWCDGPAIIAMKQGLRVVLDEIDHTSSECISLLYAVMDDSPAIMLPTGEYVTAVPGYQVIATSNGSPADLPEAVLNRVEAVVIADVPHEKAVETVRATKTAEDDALVALMNNYYRGLSRSGYEFRGNPSLRSARNFAKLRAAGMHKDVAAVAVFGKAGAEILSSMTTAGIRP